MCYCPSRLQWSFVSFVWPLVLYKSPSSLHVSLHFCLKFKWSSRHSSFHFTSNAVVVCEYPRLSRVQLFAVAAKSTDFAPQANPTCCPCHDLANTGGIPPRNSVTGTFLPNEGKQTFISGVIHLDFHLSGEI